MRKVNQDAVKFLNQVRARAAADGIRVTKAVEMLIEKMPNIGRSECYNSAAEAGINLHTACNVYDRIKGDKHGR